MRRLIAVPVSLVGLLLVAACAPEETGEAAEKEAPAVDAMYTLPVTTASAEARDHFVRGQRALDMGQPQDARPHFQRAVELDPDFALAHRGLVFSGTSLDASLAALDRASAAKAGVSGAERTLVEITEAFRENDLERQRELARELTRAYPASPRVWVELAGIQTAMDRTAEARSSLQRAIEADADFVPAHMQLGNSYLFQEPRDLDRARRAFERAVELAPDEATPHDLLADSYRMQGALERAAREYSRAAELDPDGALPVQQRGHVHSFLGNFAQARADYDAAIELGVDNEPASFAVYRAFVSVHEGKPRAAVEELEQLLARIDGMDLPDPRGQKIFALTSQAEIGLHEGMLDVAEAALEKRAELMRANARRIGTDQARRTTEADIAQWEGRLAARRGDYETALERSEEAMRLVEPIKDPTRDYGTHEVMGLAHLLQGDYEKAVSHYEQADPDDIYAAYHHALALEGADRADEAAELFEKVANWRFNSLGLALTRADAMERAGTETSGMETSRS